MQTSASSARRAPEAPTHLTSQGRRRPVDLEGHLLHPPHGAQPIRSARIRHQRRGGPPKVHLAGQLLLQVEVRCELLAAELTGKPRLVLTTLGEHGRGVREGVAPIVAVLPGSKV